MQLRVRVIVQVESPIENATMSAPESFTVDSSQFSLGSAELARQLRTLCTATVKERLATLDAAAPRRGP